MYRKIHKVGTRYRKVGTRYYKVDNNTAMLFFTTARLVKTQEAGRLQSVAILFFLYVDKFCLYRHTC